VLLTASAVLLQPLVATGADAVTKPPVPAAKALPAQIEPLPSYQMPVTCDPVAKAGPKKLTALLKQTYGSTAFGITRACSGTPSSEHQEGRAVDWMLDSTTTKADVNAFLGWLLAADKDGYTVAMARRMGIMYIVWQNKIFRVYHPDLGWQPYQDCATLKSTAYDTYCHRNHAHLSFTWDGAMAKTSYWSGVAVTVPDCDRPTGQPASASPSAQDLEYVPLAATTILDTRTGHGVTGGHPCRLAQNGYAGEGRRLDVKVAGVAGVPALAKAVLLRLRVTSPNASSRLQVQPAGAPSWVVDAETPTAGVSDSNVVTVPVGSGGAVTLSLAKGQAYLGVDVLGAFIPAGDPSGTRLHAVRPLVALDADEPAKTTVGLTRAQLGIPVSATAVALSTTVSQGSVGGGVLVYGSGDPVPPAGSAAPSTGAGRTAAAATVVRLGKGPSSEPVLSIKSGSGSRHVQVVVTGWYAPAKVAGGALYRTFRPAAVVDSSTGTGLAGPLASGVVKSVLLTGHGVPADAVAVVTEARLRSSSRTLLVAWASGTQPTAWLLANEKGRTTATQLTTRLSAGKAKLAAENGTTDVRLVALGAWVLAG
jgi:hypothetical protein